MDNKETVIVLDFGGQYNQLIARRVRECNVYCEILPYTVNIERIKEIEPKDIQNPNLDDNKKSNWNIVYNSIINGVNKE